LGGSAIRDVRDPVRFMLKMWSTTACGLGRVAPFAAAEPGIKLALVNHISYNCPNFRQAADWYSKAFNLDQIGATARDVALPFGKKGEQPYGVTAADVPLTHLIIRTRDLNAPAASAVRPARRPVATTEQRSA
jgi:hypothetical protein